MKTKLVASVSFAMTLVIVAYGYGYTVRPAGPLVSFEDYSKMENIKDRNAALAKESPRAKSVLWRQHLAFNEVKMGLNVEQKDFLKRVSDFLDNNFFAIPNNMPEAEYIKTERGKPFKELMQDAKKLFTPEQLRNLFLTVGDASTITDWGCGARKVQDSDANAENTERVHGPNASEPSNSSAAVSGCSCTESMCGSQCGSNQYCSYDCTPGGACGCFRWFTCDGTCKTIPEGTL
jgi:hypothetical protein